MAMMLTTPICPMTTLEGELERAFAAVMTLGARKDDPKPAMVKLIHNIVNEKILWSAPIKRVTKIPIKKENPEVKDPNLTKFFIEK